MFILLVYLVNMVYGKSSVRSQQVSELVRYILASYRHLAVNHFYNKDNTFIFSSPLP